MMHFVVLQIKDMLKRKECIITFYVLLAMVLINYIRNVLSFQGMDVNSMYHPMKLLLLSYNMTNYNADLTILLIQLYPFLVVYPAGFVLAKEYQTGEAIFLSSRMGNNRYRVSKFIAAFVTTFIVFTAPFFIEVVLNCLAFPMDAMGDLTNWGCYNISYLNSVDNYVLSDFYLKSTYLYTVVGIIIFGIISGVLGMFTMMFSALYKVKYNVFLFLPVFIYLNIFNMLTKENGKSLRWSDHMLLFNDIEKNIYVFATIWLFFFIMLIVGGIYARKKDCL